MEAKVMKFAKVLGVFGVAAAMNGCAIHYQEPVKDVSYLSNPESYIRPFGASPSYERGLVEVAPLRQRAEDAARSRDVAARFGALPNAAAFSTARPTATGTELEPV